MVRQLRFPLLIAANELVQERAPELDVDSARIVALAHAESAVLVAARRNKNAS